MKENYLFLNMMSATDALVADTCILRAPLHIFFSTFLIFYFLNKYLNSTLIKCFY